MNPNFILEIILPVERDFESLKEKIAGISDYSSKDAQNLQKEFMRLQKVLYLKEEYVKSIKNYKDTGDLIKNETDEEMLLLYQEEVATLEAEIDKLEKQISLALLPPDPNDDKNIFIEMRAGAGGDESSIFIGDLYRMYTLYAQARQFKVEVMDSHEGTAGGFKDLTLSIQGKDAYALFKYESGVHRVQRVPKTETQGRVHTSTVTVAIMPESEENDVIIATEDIKIETTRAQGAGGQHVNKTESAVKIYHIPTGIVVQCQDERSQHKNKEKAMRILRSKVKEKQELEQKNAKDSLRRSQIGSGDRAEKIRTYNFPQNRLTDHRINLTLYSLDRIMNGDIDPLFEQLILEDKKEALNHYLNEQKSASS
jgi:peptide chain release factor 1